jgi:isopentenyl diphosphate isomerase/L-lactate dehydrogenase-like FMN-dependent dehydrogenase
MLYALGAMGEEGVTKALQIIHKELDPTMAFADAPISRRWTKTSSLPGTYPV